MKQKIIIPIELEIWVDQKLLSGKITDIKINEKRLSKKQIKKLYEEDTNN